MTFTVSGSNGLTFSDSSTQIRGSKWGQVVSERVTDRYSVGGSGPPYYYGIGPILRIRPTSPQSKILLQFTMSYDISSYAYWTFLRDGELVTRSANNGTNSAYGIYTQANWLNNWLNGYLHFVDSPNTTSIINYQLGVSCGGTAYLNDYGQQQTTYFTAIEILP
jgi:hypothetical protein